MQLNIWNIGVGFAHRRHRILGIGVTIIVSRELAIGLLFWY
ncbi:hypothetical protein [Nostoc sp. NMS2]|nr:hypothetical protein [Nostoc sp. NMS2]